MIKYLIVFIGSGIGGGFRFWISTFVQKHYPHSFPFGTLIVNLIGSFILGYLMFSTLGQKEESETLKLLIGIGFCGGLTTFSTFSLETFNLLRSAHYQLAFVNVVISVLITILGIYLAYAITK